MGHSDLIGKRFNGHELQKSIIKRGVQSYHCVWNKISDDNNTFELSSVKNKRYLSKIFNHIDSRLSLQSLLTPWAFNLMFKEQFKLSDLVHYHVIHNGYFNIASLPILTHQKPSIWTLHDPWAITGHCIHPYQCNKWITGCGNCQDLDVEYAVSKDRTALMWKIKKNIYNKSEIDIVVASKWMLNLAQQSPLLSKFKIHHISLGVDLEKFRPMDSEGAKKDFGVTPGSVVVCFRATNSKFKGLSYIKDCLRLLKTDKRICLMTFNERGLIDEFIGKYQIIDLGWVNDDEKIVKAYNAADIFLMPSTAESFGMMAIEAMACSKPVIAFDGTSLSEIIMPPVGGVSVLQGDVSALVSALETLIDNKEMRIKIGESALRLVEENYDAMENTTRHIELYNDVLSRRKKKKI